MPKQDRRGNEPPEYGGWRVQPGREPLADLFYAECARRGLGPDYKDRPHLHALADKVLHRNPNLLVDILRNERLPKLETLLDLEEALDLPLAETLAAFGIKLHEHVRTEPPPEQGLAALTPLQRKVMHEVLRLSPAALRDVLPILKRIEQNDKT